MTKRNKALRMILMFASVYHIALGLAAIVLKTQAPELARVFFRFNLTPTPEVMWMLNPFAAYMLAFGLMLAVAASDPLRFRPVVFVAVALFGLRVVQRAMFLAYGEAELKAVTNSTQGVAHLAVVAAIGIAVLVLALRIQPAEAT